MPPGAGVFTCDVTDPVGQPLPGAEITVTDATTRREQVKGTSGPFGTFVAPLPPGEYSALISADGLQPVRRAFDVAPDARSALGQVQLMPAPHKELPAPGTWLFDPPHTAIRFIAKHVGMAHVHGRFTRFSGDIRVAERMEDSYVEVTIDAASISTGNRTRDNHLRSADFLDVANHPYLHFVSQRFVNESGSKWTIHGTLTMHGVSRSVTLDTDYLGMVNGGYGEELRCAALATAQLHRDDFTLNWRQMLARGIAVVGPTIKLELDIQAMYQSPNTPIPPE
ncbi:polyisoprenoid-binding protein YceI [Allostreptomyces psammosilenae]|uniref:Polyisoprenoid-binding protein YceI n=1 Tax=Allostreptomyces psammosilenae TaxID=1892865 RepID=A0A853A1B7_9ACTN|nr:YceI family protein [Allostreptomyces psammosilenae]NYI07240.1 polyisoprenoid-binding protein YceI [Allostreptomyces psammosilenae]